MAKTSPKTMQSTAKLGLTVSKRTSIGGRARPTNKHTRRLHKPYRGQGRP